MKYISISGDQKLFKFKDAVLNNLAPDGGLFVPNEIPSIHLSKEDVVAFSKEELLFHLLQPFVNSDLTDVELSRIISDTLSFDIPLVQIGSTDIYALELFHGPTWAFKDVGARFLSRCLSTWSVDREETTILVATSGDTGGAVAHGFFKQPGTRVIILYPLGKISALQEQQIAGLGHNIEAIAVRGTFDDCQHLVKTAFRDDAVKSRIRLTSANSINIARWMPQMIFYAIAYQEAVKKNLPLTISVPSGNYGNIAAGLLANVMGIRFEKYVASHNVNDTVPRFLRDGHYQPNPTIATIANAMDVSDPSNFVRFQWLYNKISPEDFSFMAASVNDDDILETISRCYLEHDYVLDPHTATSWKVLSDQGGKGILLATAHPQKFEDIITRAIGEYPSKWRKKIADNQIHRIVMENNFEDLKAVINEAKK